MKWFTGSVEGAIQEKTNKKALLLVHISDGGVDSTAMDEVWESVEINQIVTVALKLTAGTPSFQQFTQFYPVMVFPSAYFIGLDGTVVEVVVGKKSKEEVTTFVLRAVSTFTGSSAPPAPAGPCEAPAPRASPPREVEANPPQEAPPSLPREVAAEPAGEVPAAVQPAAPSPTTIEERLQRTREVVAQREIDRERQDEIQRRVAGAELQKMREEMEEKERKAAAEQRRKDKEADKIYMEKLRKQIEEDRAEKALRFNAEKRKAQEAREEKERKQAAEAAEKATRDQAARASVARIQFRMPSGSSVVKQFEPSDKLQKCYDIAKTLLPTMRGKVALSSVTPRRVFTAEDMDQTLADLALAPSAVLLVLKSESSATDSPNFLSLFVASFFTFLSNVWAFFAGFIWGQPAVEASGQPSPQPEASSATSSSASTSGISHRRNKTTSDEPRAGVGKVFRLHDLKRDDDDNATWNGNSTNQM